MSKKVDLNTLDRLGLLPSTIKRHRSIVAQFKKELRKGTKKSQAIYNAAEAKGTSESNVYRALQTVKRLG